MSKPVDELDDILRDLREEDSSSFWQDYCDELEVRLLQWGTRQRLESVKHLSDYYIRHDGEGEHKLAAEIIKVEAELQASLKDGGNDELD